MLQNTGGDTAGFLLAQAEVARDNSRTPMQWNAGPNAGFTTGTPWLKVNENNTSINVEAADKDPNSILNYVRKLIKTRKANPVLIYGRYTELDHLNNEVFAYTRELDGRKVLVLLSFSDKGGLFSLPEGMTLGKELIGNYDTPLATQDNKVILKPWQAVVVEVK
jgi:oligo-1,6-glucosidase